jgi:hypothetical protein
MIITQEKKTGRVDVDTPAWRMAGRRAAVGKKKKA